jgi:hypothetical protein
MIGFSAAAALLLCISLAACNRAARDPSPSELSPQNASPVVSGSAAASARPPSARLSDPLWQRAQGDDPLDRARLAEAEGAARLVDALEDGGEIARVALLALADADDAEIALGRLAQMALDAPAGQARSILEAILAIAGQPVRPREPLDPEGVRACGEALLVLASRAELDRSDRAIAVSAARALAGKGLLDESRIPGDLDVD